MGTVKCERCGGHIEANSIEEGAEKLYHAVGLAAGHPCDAARAELVMIGEPQAPKAEPKVEKPKVEESKRSSKANKSSENEAS